MDEFLADIGVPEGDFHWEGDEAGDWTPYYCDDCDTWHKTASATEFKRTGDRVEVYVRTVDQDGDWDTSCGFNSADGDDWDAFHRDLSSADELGEHFKGWAEYHLWCAETLRDPLEDNMRETTPLVHAQHALDYAKYLAPRK
jgi:hypothetical protein